MGFFNQAKLVADLLARASIILFIVFGLARLAIASGNVVISEVAWSGTKASSADEWIELYNNTDTAVDLAGWGIYEGGGSVLTEELTGTIAPRFFYLIERTDESTVADITASQAPSSWGGSGLANGGEYIVLKNAAGQIIDEVNAVGGWFAGAAGPDYFSMERIDFLSGGGNPVNWQSNNGVTRNGLDAAGNPINGTPLAPNSVVGPASGGQEQSGGNQNGGGQNQGGEIIVVSPAPLAIQNNPPIASAGESKLAAVGEKIIFDGRASSDSDGDVLSFLWNFGDGATSGSADTFYIYNFPGEYLVTLEVSDGKEKAAAQISAYVYPRGIVISEFMPDPISQDEDGEWIEIFNGSKFVVNLAGWQLDDETDGGSKPFTFPENSFILPGRYLVVPRSVSKIALNNTGGEEVRLLLPRGAEIDRIVYDKTKEGYAAVRSGKEIFWSRTTTPGFANIVLGGAGEIVGGEAVGALIVEEAGNKTIVSSGREAGAAPLAVGFNDGAADFAGESIPGLAKNSGDFSLRQGAALVTINNTRQNTATAVLISSIILSAAIWGLYFKIQNKKYKIQK